jgi:eukaryotic-like serine/threonine-protein kinase
MASTVLSDRYELGRVLGRGGMAEVREARDVVLGRRVAVKILHPALAEDQRSSSGSGGRRRSWRRSTTPSMVAIFDAGIDGDAHYLVMEFLEGLTLGDLLRMDGRSTRSRWSPSARRRRRAARGA